MKTKPILFCLFMILAALRVDAQQTQSDSYTQYQLLDPSTQAFRIIYDVTATTPEAVYYWNTLRQGSEHDVHQVIDLYTGGNLDWKIVSGEQAKSNGHFNASIQNEYLQVRLARPVPLHGESRIRIDKTYRDPASYYEIGNQIFFERALGIKRNSIVLPQGFEVVECNFPVQVQLTNQNQIKLSFMNNGPASVPLKIVGKPLSKPNAIKTIITPYDAPPPGVGRDKSRARIGWIFSERAFQNREIVYFLQQPETHSFLLYHDYTETRKGMDRYLNIVRAGSKASNPSARNLDTGEELKVETLIGDQITAKGIEIGEASANTEVIVVWFDPVKEGASTRLRITETYEDPNRYLLNGEELVWDRSFGRNRNEVVLPSGWFLTSSSIPGKIQTDDDGLIRLIFQNDRPDVIDVHITAQRRN